MGWVGRGYSSGFGFGWLLGLVFRGDIYVRIFVSVFEFVLGTVVIFISMSGDVLGFVGVRGLVGF